MCFEGSVKKKGLIPVDYAAPSRDSGDDDIGNDEGGTAHNAWCPDEDELLARNRDLENEPQMARKRFAIAELRKTVPVSAYLGKLLPDVGGKSMESIPPPFVVLFGSVLQSFCAGPRHCEAPRCRMWLLLLLEALATEEFGMKIFPRAKPNRIFTTVGHFARVSNDPS